MKSEWIFLAVFAVCLLHGCAATKKDDGYVLVSSSRGMADSRALFDSLSRGESFLEAHRVLVTFDGGGQLDFSGLVKVFDGERLDGTAFNDFGGKLFDISVSLDSETLRTVPPGIPEDVAREGVAADLRATFLRPRNCSGRIVARDSPDGVVRRISVDDSAYYFNTGSLRFMGLETFRDGRLERRVVCSGGGRGRPSRMEIQNFRFGYKAEVGVLESKLLE